MKYIDLFAGCGGLSLGLRAAGWHGLFAIEKDPMAFSTLKANFLAKGAPYPHFEDWPAWLAQGPHDIIELLSDPVAREALTALRGSIDLVAGGPPCQGFSVGGARNGADLRNRLFENFLDVVDLVQPRAVLVENVEGMARRFASKPGQFSSSVADHVVDELAIRGYAAGAVVVNASFFGVPQVRRRLAIIGLLGADDDAGTALVDALHRARTQQLRDLGLPQDRPITALEAIDDLDGSARVPCPDSDGYESGTYSGAAKSKFARLMRAGARSAATPDSHRFSKHGDRILSWYRQAHATQKPGRLSKEFMRSLGTKKDKKVLVDPAKPVSTITTHPDEFIHFRHPRNITVREMARLQSFPDNFVFRGRYTINGPRRRFDVARCSQVGNAVPPLMAQAVGTAIADLLGAGVLGEEKHAPSDAAIALKAGSARVVRQQQLPIAS